MEVNKTKIESLDLAIDFYLKMNYTERVHDILEYYTKNLHINPDYAILINLIKEKLKMI